MKQPAPAQKKVLYVPEPMQDPIIKIEMEEEKEEEKKPVSAEEMKQVVVESENQLTSVQRNVFEMDRPAHVRLRFFSLSHFLFHLFLVLCLPLPVFIVIFAPKFFASLFFFFCFLLELNAKLAFIL